MPRRVLALFLFQEDIIKRGGTVESRFKKDFGTKIFANKQINKMYKRYPSFINPLLGELFIFEAHFSYKQTKINKQQKKSQAKYHSYTDLFLVEPFIFECSGR